LSWLNFLNFLLLSLSCYRLSNLITREKGPFNIFEQLRILTGAYDYDNQGIPKSELGLLVSCPYCLGMWIAVPLSIIGNGLEWYTLVYWLAIAGLQSFLQGLSK